MAKKQQPSEGFWPRMIITIVVIVWVAVLGGNWIGRAILEREGDRSSTVQTSMPTQQRKPWINPGTELQKEVDDVNLGTDGKSSAGEVTVVATPLEEQSTASEPRAEATEAGEDSPLPTPQSLNPDERKQKDLAMLEDSSSAPPLPTPALQVKPTVLHFGTFNEKTNADGVMQRLKEAGFVAMCEPVKVQSGTVYRVCSKPFDDMTMAKEKAEELKGRGFDVYIVE